MGPRAAPPSAPLPRAPGPTHLLRAAAALSGAGRGAPSPRVAGQQLGAPARRPSGPAHHLPRVAGSLGAAAGRRGEARRVEAEGCGAGGPRVGSLPAVLRPPGLRSSRPAGPVLGSAPRTRRQVQRSASSCGGAAPLRPLRPPGRGPALPGRPGEAAPRRAGPAPPSRGARGEPRGSRGRGPGAGEGCATPPGRALGANGSERTRVRGTRADCAQWTRARGAGGGRRGGVGPHPESGGPGRCALHVGRCCPAYGPAPCCVRRRGRN